MNQNEIENAESFFDNANTKKNLATLRNINLGTAKTT
jgi:hypothetical protein